MPARDLLERVVEHFQKVRVRHANGSVQLELDHRAHPADRCYFADADRDARLLLADVGRKIHDLVRHAARITERLVAALQPHFPAALADSPVPRAIAFPARKLGPERAILAAIAVSGCEQYAVMPTAELIERVAEQLQEHLVGGPDGPVQLALDHRLCVAACRQSAAQLIELACIERDLALRSLADRLAACSFHDCLLTIGLLERSFMALILQPPFWPPCPAPQRHLPPDAIPSRQCNPAATRP